MPRTIDFATTESLIVAASDTATVTFSGRITRPDSAVPSGFLCIDADLYATITIDGYVANQGTGAYAVRTAMDTMMTVGTGGEVLGGYAAVSYRNGGTLNNNGLISGGAFGLLCSAGTYTITNSGTVEATGTSQDSGIAIYFPFGSAFASLNLINSGLIRATTAVFSTERADSVVNTGRIEGGISLRGGNDLYDGRNGGVIVGTIYLGDGNDTLYGSSGAETVDGGPGSDTLEGGGGNDAYVCDSNDTIVESIDGGIDTVRTATDVAALAANVENIVAIRSDDLALTGNDLANSIKGYTGNDTLTGGKGNDTLDGGDGEDTAVFSGPRSNYRIDYNPDGTATVTDLFGQDGTDLLKSIRHLKFGTETSILNYAPTDLVLSSTRVSENAPARTEVGRLSAQDEEGDSLTYSIVSDPDGAFAIEGRSLVLARPLNYEAKAQHQVTVKAKDQYGGETSRIFTIMVTDEVEIVPNFLMRGTPKADRLAGQEGNDTLYGAAGNDMLTGGAGKDIFVFDTKPNKKTNLDTITDFSVPDDTVWLDNKYLKKLGKGSASKPGALKKGFFKVADKAKDKDDYLIYSKKGILYYDPDGSGAGKQVEIAKLAKNLKLTAADFFVI